MSYYIYNMLYNVCIYSLLNLSTAYFPTSSTTPLYVVDYIHKNHFPHSREREMKGSFIFSPSFLILVLFFGAANSQDSCNSPLSLERSLPFDTASLQCVSVWPPQSFILRYQQASTNVWNFLLSAPNTNAYIGIGFSPNGKMVGSTAIVGWVQPDTTTDMKMYYLGAQSPDQVIVVKEGNLKLGNSSMTVQSNQIYMAFQLIVDAPEKQLIYSVGQRNRLPSGPDYALTQHQDQISTLLNYATGQFQKENPDASLKRSHGILNMLGWGILMPIGVLVARHMRQWDPIWFYSHSIIQSFGFVLGVAGVICGIVLEDRLGANVNKHKGLGIFILTLGCLQVIAFLARPDKESKVRKYWNWYHFSVGRILIFLAAVNVFYGIHLGNAGTGWNAGFAVVLVTLFIVGAILELRMWKRK
ncbi:cytochrome b561 and DOMON domain-containing At3g07570-like [Olea europaea subsp. europaea]|uniref:Cytochrome b561 and DOMON domain-containing At3g07570-like n=1 Tax=Olea europaea subsp. europaea TaxID=158383 RepID=A0A8S0Q277_OLEEU|nr:cytochrome b561 and DOMON domain-containing At3g07570-like [Olea europaea subsp. europaea]